MSNMTKRLVPEYDQARARWAAVGRELTADDVEALTWAVAGIAGEQRMKSIMERNSPRL